MSIVSGHLGVRLLGGPGRVVVPAAMWAIRREHFCEGDAHPDASVGVTSVAKAGAEAANPCR